MGLRTRFTSCVALGAKMVDFGGWDMPLHYGSQVEEHHQVRRDCGVFDVSHMTVVDVAGEQATPICSISWRTTWRASARPARRSTARCSTKGRGGRRPDRLPDRERLPGGGQRLHPRQGHRLDAGAGRRLQVDLQERGDLAMLAIQGPNARVHSSELVSPARAADSRTQAVPGPCRGRLVHRPHRLHRRGRPGDHAAGRRGAGLPQRVGWRRDLPGGPGARDTLRLEAGLNLYGQDMDESVSPLAANMGWTVAWEPVARDFVGRRALEAQKPPATSRSWSAWFWRSAACCAPTRWCG